MARYDINSFCTTSRRQVLAGIVSLASAAAWSTQVWANPVFRSYPFTLGVASGDPAPDGFVIWTRLAPAPFDGGGMPNRIVAVDWEVASDRSFAHIIAKGTAPARPELGHSVHVEVNGLQPASDYFYRFIAGSERSQVGRARTFVAAGAPLAAFKLGVAGCQRYDDGFFTAYRHMAEENFDLIFHYGDYIYEYRQIAPGERATPVARSMPRDYDETFTLVDYRNRYATYKADPDLQAAHASAPFAVSFDDHEVDNNWAGDVSEEADVPAEVFRLRREAAFQAWYEHMPVRLAQFPRGAAIQAYRRFRIGDLVTLNVLDTRQFRSDQPCGDGWKICPEASDPARTMMGEQQENWLYDGFRSQASRWNVLAQQVLMMQLDRDPDPARLETHMDKWDSAVAARNRLFSAIRDSSLSNPVVLTGDIHNNWAGELKADFNDPSSQTLGVEFVATSISSGGDGADSRPDAAKMLSLNPHVKFFNNHRGYMRHMLTPERWTADYRTLERVTRPGEPVKTRQSFVLESGSTQLNNA